MRDPARMVDIAGQDVLIGQRHKATNRMLGSVRHWYPASLLPLTGYARDGLEPLQIKVLKKDVSRGLRHRWECDNCTIAQAFRRLGVESIIAPGISYLIIDGDIVRFKVTAAAVRLIKANDQATDPGPVVITLRPIAESDRLGARKDKPGSGGHNPNPSNKFTGPRTASGLRTLRGRPDFI